MSDFPSLAEVLRQHTGIRDPYRQCEVCVCDKWADTDHGDNGQTHAEHQADAWREACTIRTVEQLDALPEGAIVRGASEGHAYEKSLKWTMVGRRWWEAGNSSPESPDRILLPALLIWSPDWARP